MIAKVHLDKLAAERAQAIVKKNREAIVKKNRDQKRNADDVDNLVTKALGVLQENGLYACGLYLLSRTQKKEQDIAGAVRAELVNLLAALPFGWGRPETGRPEDEALLAYLSGRVAGDPHLERLLLAKETLEQMLIYARYGAKAWKAESKQEGG